MFASGQLLPYQSISEIGGCKKTRFLYIYIGLYRLSRSKHDDYERHAKGNQEDEGDQLSPVSCGVVAGLSGELFRGHVLLDFGHILGKEKHENGHTV